MKRKLNLKFFGLVMAGTFSLAYVNNSNLFLANNVFATEENSNPEENSGIIDTINNLEEKAFNILESKFKKEEGCSECEILSGEEFDKIRELVEPLHENGKFTEGLDLNGATKRLIKKVIDKFLYTSYESFLMVQAYKAAEYIFNSDKDINKEDVKEYEEYARGIEEYIKDILEERGFKNNQIDYAIKELKAKYNFITR